MYQTLQNLNNINMCFLNNQVSKTCLTNHLDPNYVNQLYFYQGDKNNPLHC